MAAGSVLLPESGVKRSEQPDSVVDGVGSAVTAFGIRCGCTLPVLCVGVMIISASLRTAEAQHGWDEAKRTDRLTSRCS